MDDKEETLFMPKGSLLTIAMEPYFSQILKFVDGLVERKLEPLDAVNCAMEFSNQFLHFTNNTKMAESIQNSGGEIYLSTEDPE